MNSEMAYFTLYKLWTHCLGQCVQCLFKQNLGSSKRVLRLIYFADRREDAITLLVNAKLLPVTFLYYEVL